MARVLDAHSAPEGAPLDHLKFAWEVISKNFVGWIIFGIVWSLVTSFTGGLGLFLLPNAIRASRKAIASDAQPEVGELFVFDNIADDSITMLGQFVANFAGGLLCGVGVFVTAPMFLFAPFIAAEDSYDGVGSLKASLAHGKSNIMGNLIQMLIIGILLQVFLVVTLGFGAFISMPIAIVAFEHFYQEQRPQVLAAAQAAQIAAKG
jgi:hypothetical protein